MFESYNKNLQNFEEVLLLFGISAVLVVVFSSLGRRFLSNCQVASEVLQQSLASAEPTA